jgi:hypothetical protein
MPTKLPSKPGRKPSLVADDKTIATIEGLAKIQCTQGEAAAVLGVSRDTLHNFFTANPSVRERWDNGLEGGKASLRRNQFKLSETNATMCIWLGKQYLGQRDMAVIEHTGEGGGDIGIKVSDVRNAIEIKLARLAMVEGTAINDRHG